MNSPHATAPSSARSSARSTPRSIERLSGTGGSKRLDDDVAEEAPLELQLAANDEAFRPLAVVMRTPDDDDSVDEDLALGFLLSEGLIDGFDDVARVAACTVAPTPEAEGNVIQVRLAPGRVVVWERLTRHTFSSSSCGVCGKATIEAACETRGPLPRRAPPLSLAEAVAMTTILRTHQPLFAATGAVHGAAVVDLQGALCVVREDVGRHNAVDKVVGALLRSGAVRSDRDRDDLTLVVSGRIAFEIVQKALAARIGRIVGVGAPTSLAVDLALGARLGLYGFVRAGQMNRYA